MQIIFLPWVLQIITNQLSNRLVRRFLQFFQINNLF